MTVQHLISDETLFRDIDIFAFNHTPDTIRYRDHQLRKLAEAVRPALLGGCPLNTILRGPPGTGKTTCVRQIFSEIETDAHCVIPVLVNCRNIHTEFRVFVKIFEHIFGHKPPLSGIPLQRLTDPVGAYLARNNAALLVCLDDADCLVHNHLFDKVIGPLLRMYEEYPGVKTGVITILNGTAPVVFDPSVYSVYQPEEIPFPLYREEEVQRIFRDRIRTGIHHGVISPGVLDCITSLTLQTGDIRVGFNLLNRSVLHADDNARTVVTEEDVRASFQVAQMDNFTRILPDLKGDEQRLLLHLAEMKIRNNAGVITSGILYKSFARTVPVSYTAFYTWLNKLADLRIITCIAGSVKGNTREVVLLYDPGRVAALLSKGKGR